MKLGMINFGNPGYQSLFLNAYSIYLDYSPAAASLRLSLSLSPSAPRWLWLGRPACLVSGLHKNVSKMLMGVCSCSEVCAACSASVSAAVSAAVSVSSSRCDS